MKSKNEDQIISLLNFAKKEASFGFRSDVDGVFTPYWISLLKVESEQQFQAQLAKALNQKQNLKFTASELSRLEIGRNSVKSFQ